jgi:hypothetical protein
MLTIKDCILHEQWIQRESQSEEFKYSERLRKKLGREMTHIRMIRLYLEHNPTKEFLEAEEKRIEALIKGVSKNYKDWNPQKGAKKSMRLFLKVNGLQDAETQLKNIRFILYPPQSVVSNQAQ